MKPLAECTEESRIWRKFYHIYERNLIDNKIVHSLSERLVNEFQTQIFQVANEEWTISCIDSLLRHIMFQASTRTLAGPRVFELDPHFEENLSSSFTSTPGSFRDYSGRDVGCTFLLPVYLLLTQKTFQRQPPRKTDRLDVKKSTMYISQPNNKRRY